MRKQMNALRKRPRIIVATPGRLNDHLRRRSVNLSKTEILVLDEGDRMLDMGFAPQLDQILEYLPEKRQTSLFTATLPKKVRELAESYLCKPEQIDVGRTSLPVAAIKQSVVQVAFKQKDDRIVDELNQRTGSVIVFARTQRRTDILFRVLKEFGFDAEIIHGGRTQGQRNRAIRSFKDGKCRILCATDIAARGIDVPQVEHVINYDLPMMMEDYVHRIGRTARNGAKGEAVSFVSPEDHRFWQQLARKYKIENVELKGVSKDDSRGGRNKSSGGRFKRSSGGRPSGGGRSRFGRSSGGRPGGGGRPDRDRSSGARSNGGRPSFGQDRPAEGRFSRSNGSEERSSEGRSFAPRGRGKPSFSNDRPSNDRPSNDRPSGGRSFDPRGRGKPSFSNDRPSNDRPSNNRPSEGRSFAPRGGGKPSFSNDRPSNDRPSNNRPSEGRSFAPRSFGKPSERRPGDKPRSDKKNANRAPSNRKGPNKPGGSFKKTKFKGGGFKKKSSAA
jgi:ATP-dependent RNA helicase DeaD